MLPLNIFVPDLVSIINMRGFYLMWQLKAESDSVLSLVSFVSRRHVCFQANGIKIGPQHSPTNPNLPSGSQGSMQGGGCC